MPTSEEVGALALCATSPQRWEPLVAPLETALTRLREHDGALQEDEEYDEEEEEEDLELSSGVSEIELRSGAKSKSRSRSKSKSRSRSRSRMRNNGQYECGPMGNAETASDDAVHDAIRRVHFHPAALYRK